MAIIGYYNGEFVDVDHKHLPMDERGHQFGDGVYEVVRVYGGRPFLLEGHLDRLQRSLAMVGISNPHTREEWIELVGEAIRRSGEAESQVYWQVTRGIAARNHLFPDTKSVVSLTVRPVRGTAKPQCPSLLALPDERWANAFVKSINLLPNVLAKEVAHRSGAVEALLVRNGVMTEGAGSNVWFVHQGVLYTHPANRYILGGITRQFVLELAHSVGVPVREEPVALETLDGIDEIFVTSTTQEIGPILRVFADPSTIPSLHQLDATAPTTLVPMVQEEKTLWSADSVGPVTQTLQAAYAQAIERVRNGEPVMQ